MLKVIDLHVNYGGIRAIRGGINLAIKENQIVTLIGGANGGAGKSSTLRAIMGLVDEGGGGRCALCRQGY